MHANSCKEGALHAFILYPSTVNGMPSFWGAGRKWALHWLWLGLYLLSSLLLLQPARMVNTQADSLVSDHLLPGLVGLGAGRGLSVGKPVHTPILAPPGLR